MRVLRLSSLLLLLAALGVASAQEPSTAEPLDGPRVRAYGFLKLDGAYDSQYADPGNFVRWVVLPPSGGDDDAFSMTANQSRFGLEVTERASGRREISARVEVDFYGGGAQNKSQPMLRHAYFKITWPQSGFELLAGQTSDVHSPLAPATLNYSVAWWAGNIGYRRPQIRLSRTVRREGGGSVEWAAAVARNLGDTDSLFTTCDSGADAARPALQARVGLTHPHGNGGSVVVGLSGHLGKEELDLNAAGDSESFQSFSLNLDWKMTFGPRTTLRGELFRGENLSAYLGGIGQGVNLALGREIGSQGGWITLDLARLAHFDWTLGVSAEAVDDEHLDVGGRSRNRSLFANGVYSLTGSAKAGLELSHWTTEYKESDSADDLRVQLSVFYSF